MSKIVSPHDLMFKTAMKDIRVAREFFETYLPEEVKKAVNLNHLVLSPNTYVDDQLNASESDILYETQIGNEPAYLYLLAEHQSSPDKLLPFRLIKYMTRIWDDHLKQKQGKKLPLIIQVVFYHGRRPYTYSRDIKDLISAPKDLIEKLLFAPFHLVDTHDIPDETLRKKYWFGTMAFFMKHIFARDFLPYLKEALSVLHRLEESEGSNYVTNLLNYLLTTAEIPNIEEFVDTIKEGLSAPTGENIMTIAEQLIERGKQYGKLEGEQMILINQLNYRFSSLQPRYENRIKNARPEDLLLWSKKIFSAKNIDEVFGE